MTTVILMYTKEILCCRIHIIQSLNFLNIYSVPMDVMRNNEKNMVKQLISENKIT